MSRGAFLVVWSAHARRSLNRLPEKVTPAVVALVHGQVAGNPHRLGKPLHFELVGLHSARRGDYRVLYAIDDENWTVEIVAVEHRADVYRSRGAQ